MSDHTNLPEEGRTVRWCVTHDREAKHHFIAAVCPNDAGCEVVERPEHSDESER